MQITDKEQQDTYISDKMKQLQCLTIKRSIRYDGTKHKNSSDRPSERKYGLSILAIL